LKVFLIVFLKIFFGPKKLYPKWINFYEISVNFEAPHLEVGVFLTLWALKNLFSYE